MERHPPADVPSVLSDIPTVVHLSGGEFLTGQEDGRDEERPVDRVRISPFGLGRTHVTNSQYDLFGKASKRPTLLFRRQKELDRLD